MSLLYYLKTFESSKNSLITDYCQQIIPISEEEIQKISFAFSLINQQTQKLNLQIILSFYVLSLTLLSIIVLQRM